MRSIAMLLFDNKCSCRCCATMPILAPAAAAAERKSTHSMYRNSRKPMEGAGGQKATSFRNVAKLETMGGQKECPPGIIPLRKKD